MGERIMEQVSKGMMEELNTAKIRKTPHGLLHEVINETSGEFRRIINWYSNSDELTAEEAQVKIIQHVYLNNPQFEEEKPKKYIVRSKQADDQGDFIYLSLEERYRLTYSTNTSDFYTAEKFDTREEAEKWTNPLMEVIEVEE